MSSHVVQRAMRLVLLLLTMALLRATHRYPQSARGSMLRGAAERTRALLTVGSAASAALPARAASSGAPLLGELKLDYERVVACMNRNRVFQQLDFISSPAVKAIESSILAAYGSKFKTSGLSNRRRASTDQGFDGALDRAVAPFVPTADSPEVLRALQEVTRRLRLELSVALRRPSMARDDLAHEAYFSRSGPGVRLPRHLDERSESLKGRLGYLLRSRRSVSWLLYVHSCDWGAANGGELRTYPQARSVSGPVVVSGRDVQVAWLGCVTGLYPVFLAVQPSLDEGVLYVVKGGFRKEIVSTPIPLQEVNSLGFACFERRMIAGIRTTDRPSGGNELWAIEDAPLWERGGLPAGATAEDVTPSSGSLVLFDSVSLPHEVLPVKAGSRLAAAGWFHEEVV